MLARTGDRIVVEGATAESPRRRCEVLEVVGTADQGTYRVRWEDGHESIYIPGADAHVVTTAG